MSAVFDNVRNGEYSIEYLKKMAISALALSLGTYGRFHCSSFKSLHYYKQIKQAFIEVVST